MKKTTAPLTALLAVSALGNAFLLGAKTTAPPPPSLVVPYGAAEMPESAQHVAATLLDGAPSTGLTCSRPHGGQAFCTDGVEAHPITDVLAEAIGLKFGTVAISMGPDGKVYAR